MKTIYVVITYTGTMLSKIIKMYTKNEFSHVSIALDLELKQMYSFGRLNPYNPFIGGFVHEYINKGTFKRFYKTKAKICELQVTDEQYKNMQEIINKIEKEKDKYTFNVIGLFAAGFHKKIGKEQSFYCAEFVKYVIEKSGIDIRLPDVIKPEDFKYVEEFETIYTGLLRKYKPSKVNLRELIRRNMIAYTQKEGIIWGKIIKLNFLKVFY